MVAWSELRIITVVGSTVRCDITQLLAGAGGWAAIRARGPGLRVCIACRSHHPTLAASAEGTVVLRASSSSSSSSTRRPTTHGNGTDGCHHAAVPLGRTRGVALTSHDDVPGRCIDRGVGAGRSTVVVVASGMQVVTHARYATNSSCATAAATLSQISSSLPIKHCCMHRMDRWRPEAWPYIPIPISVHRPIYVPGCPPCITTWCRCSMLILSFASIISNTRSTRR